MKARTMTKIAIAGFQHETNTFAPGFTTLQQFLDRGGWPGLTRGEQIFQEFQGLNIPIAGFFEACNHDIHPILWAMAEPGGYVADDAFETITEEIVRGVVACAPDALYLDLHGAMVTQNFDDAEAEILRRLRAKMGDSFPIVISLDLHANISPALFDLADAIAIYRTYPHVDFAETGARAAVLLDHVLEGPLFKAFRQIPFLMPITAQSTHHEPAKSLYAALPYVPAVSVDIAMGFPPVDIPDCGPCVVAYANTQTQADEDVETLTRQFIAAEPEFDAKLMSAAAAVEKATNLPGPVIIADPQDNPGAGGTGDTTGILRALVFANVSDAILGLLFDPISAAKAHEAGVGAQISVSLGGAYRQYSEPFSCRVSVVAITDGIFRCTGPMFAGNLVDLGKMARLRIENTGIEIVVNSNKCQNLDQEFFRNVGLEPKDHKIICVKSAVHFMADYQRVTDKILFAVSNGANPCDLSNIPYTRLRAGLRY
jgi:microcystin degradation protein MlrC